MVNLKEQKKTECFSNYIDLFNLGTKFLNQNNLDSAIKKFTQAIQLKPNKTEAYGNRGLSFFKKSNYKQALADFSKVVELNPTDSIAYHYLGLCYTELELYSFALDNYNKAIELDFNNFLIYGARATCYLNQKDYEPAIVDFEKVIQLSPNNDIAYLNSGACYLKLKNYNTALFYLNKGLQLKPDDSQAYSIRGSCYKELKKYDLALFDYNKSIQLNPHEPETYYNLANYYLDLKEYNLALNNYSKAINLNENDAKFYCNRGSCNLNLKNYEVALVDLTKSIQLNPNDYIAYNNRGFCYLALKNYKLALADFDKSLKINPNSTETYTGKITCYFELGKHDLALSEIEKIKLSDYHQVELGEKNLNLNLAQQELKKINKSLKKAKEQLREKNEQLEQEIQQKEEAQKVAHEKEKEMLSFFTHTMRNALSSAPESLRQAIRLLGSEDYEKNKIHYEAINEITALFSTLSLVDCLVDTFKQSIYDPEKFKLNWENDNTGEATPQWFIAAALRQSLNRIIFISNTRNLIKLLQGEVKLIKPTRKAFIEQVLPLDIDQQGVESFYQWLNTIPTMDISIEESTVHFEVNQIKFSLLFSITSELIFNALKYWSGTGQIQIRWYIEQDYYIFTVKNACKKNASSNLAGTHQGLAFINRLMELLDDKTIKTHNPAQFNCYPEEKTFTAELKLHKTLLENNS